MNNIAKISIIIPDGENDFERINVNTDNENQNHNGEEVIEIQTPLKGILKKPEEYIYEQKRIEIRLFKLCFILLFIVIMTPIIFCDLYFGFTDISCSRETPDKLDINLRLYLLVSGFIGLSILFIILITIILFEYNTNSESSILNIYCCNFSILFILISLFNLIWNIIGGIVFWGYIYGTSKCNKTISTYLFVSLIIKFVGSLFTSQLNKKRN